MYTRCSTASQATAEGPSTVKYDRTVTLMMTVVAMTIWKKMILYNVRFGSNRCAIFYELSFVLRVGLLPCMLIKYLSLSIYILIYILYCVNFVADDDETTR